MAFSNQCLIGFSFPTEISVLEIQNKLQDICECGEIVKCSTVYKQTVTKKLVPMSVVRFVVKFSTYLSAEQMIYLLDNNLIEGDPLLLAFNQQVVLSPKVTLPYPYLVTDVLLLRCSSEVWSQYEHPVLQKTLGEVVKTAEMNERAEFFMQGESLIAF